MGYADEVISSRLTGIRLFTRTGLSHITADLLAWRKALIDAANLAKSQEASESSSSLSTLASTLNEEASQDPINGGATKPPPDLPISPHVQLQDPKPAQERKEGLSPDASLMSIASPLDAFENQLSQFNANIKVDLWGLIQTYWEQVRGV
ncbi:hypothetical protein V5O48_015935 [Marasmius crinis-equi]|uniref:Uncharacterized protein n=1 Tax=Marasmius crinis-equi TaxID=585013 RepID=A0ABR3ET76_9AGAR